jgi:hypothetical protein
VTAAGTADDPTTPARLAPSDALLRTVLSLVTNVTVLTALLVYFGWRRSFTQSKTMGLDETVFGLTTRDYALRSVGSVFLPLVVAAVVGLAWMWLDGLARRGLSVTKWWPLVLGSILRWLRWAWLLVPALSAAAVAILGRGQTLLALSFGLGVLVSVHAASLQRDLDAQRGLPSREPSWSTEVARGLVLLLVLVSAFWAVTLVADSRGVALADAVEAGIRGRPPVVVHSTVPLHIDAPSVTEQRLADDAYRYTGLRLLHHQDGRFLLVHDGWTRREGVLLILHDDDTLRFEIGGPRSR